MPMDDTLQHPLFNELSQINWQAPWLAHIPPSLCNMTTYLPTNDTSINLADRLNPLLPKNQPMVSGMGKPLQFISQASFDKLANSTAYETHIASTGQIPTRDNLHDLFNAWIWFTFPQTKAMLNRYQAQQINADGIASSRGRMRDAITIFDECGAVFVTSDTAIANALKNFDWQNALVNPRANWDTPFSLNTTATTAVYIFGHATLEQLVEPRKPICSHCKIILVEDDFFRLNITQRIAYLDNRLTVELSDWLNQEGVTPRQLSPLPILGVPHFWAENADNSFYEDTFVFRSGRQNKPVKKDKQKTK